MRTGISLKTQDMLLVVSLSRYLIFTSFYTTYNSAMKAFYVTSSLFMMCYSMRWVDPIKSTYRADQDIAEPWKHAVLPCVVVVVLLKVVNGQEFDFFEVCWHFSILLEPIALFPQAVMYRRYRQVESLAGGTFLLLMGSYRFLYIINWIFRANTETHYRHHILVYVCGCAQVVVASWGLFWYTSGEAPSAPLLPQLFQFFRETHWSMFGLPLAFIMGPTIYRTVFGERSFDAVLWLLAIVLMLVPCVCCVYLNVTSQKSSATTSDVPTNTADEEDPTTKLSTPLLAPIDETEQTAPVQSSQGEYEAPRKVPTVVNGITVV